MNEQLNDRIIEGHVLSAYTSKGRKVATFLPDGPWRDDDAFLRAQLVERAGQIVDNGETLDMRTFDVSPMSALAAER